MEPATTSFSTHFLFPKLLQPLLDVITWEIPDIWEPQREQGGVIEYLANQSRRHNDVTELEEAFPHS